MPQPEKISFVRLADWIEGRLSGEEARVLEERLALADDATREDVAWLRAFFRVSENAALDPLPPEARDELVGRYEAYLEGRRPGFLQRLAAKLTFDSASQPAVGIRATAQGPNRQLIYSTDAADVALDIRARPYGKNLDLEGQVFPDEAEPGSFSVQLLDGTDELGITTTGELGDFVFESVPPGVYEVLLSTDRTEITIAPLELRP